MKYCLKCGEKIKIYKKRQSPNYCDKCVEIEENWNPQLYPSGLILEKHNKNKCIINPKNINEIKMDAREIHCKRFFGYKNYE